MDGLKRSHLLEELTGNVHLTQYDAVTSSVWCAERAPVIEHASSV
jgi:hypothetical protein